MEPSVTRKPVNAIASEQYSRNPDKDCEVIECVHFISLRIGHQPFLVYRDAFRLRGHLRVRNPPVRNLQIRKTLRRT